MLPLLSPQAPLDPRSLWRTLSLWGPLSLALIAGCARPPEESFSVAEAVTTLSELHQQNIKDGLRAMFGTPSLPRLAPIKADATDEDTSATDATRADAAEETFASSLAAGVIDPRRLPYGAQVYRNRCSGCHGISGDGQGAAAAYLRPKPRDYREGVYKFTSTPYGYRPVRQDLIRTIRRGAKGTSMPAFPWLSDEDLEAVVDYVIYLSLRGSVEAYVAEVSEDYDEDEAIDTTEFTDALETEVERWQQAEASIVRPISAEPADDEQSVELGRRLFIKSSCYQCHGVDAEGQTEWLSPDFIAAQEAAPPESRIQINYDKWGQPAPAANITARMLHGGRRPIDIYRRIYTGINGTPMPAFGEVFQDDPAAIWHMVHYVMHIVEGGDPTLGIGLQDVLPTPSTQEQELKPAA